MTVASSNSSESPAARGLGLEAQPPAAPNLMQDPIPKPHTPGLKPEEPLIELRDVGVWYQLHRKRRSIKRALLSGVLHEPPRVLWALRHINLTCHRGQTIGIVGHNGAGKSTLCLALARILTPDEGQITVRGNTTPLFGLGTCFNLNLTGRANIHLYSAFLGIPKNVVARKIDEIIAFSELGDFIDEPIYTYSSGMRARLGFSVAAILEPEILILDEVLGTGDRQFRAKSRAKILKMMEQSKLIFIVSHMTGFLWKTCTHCLWLDHGQCRMFGEARQVLRAYEDATGGPAEEEHED
jgi:ABC-type polysaccharide/polyol phosphate transport system ATPase subunit